MARSLVFGFLSVFASLAFVGAQPAERPKAFTNSLGMKFVWIPPATFAMGSPNSEKERADNEVPHKVTLTKGFYLSVHPVTQEEWSKLMPDNRSEFKGSKNPVETVSWDDCQEFIKLLGKKESRPYRLPTEAEWECACRGGTTTPFHFGETISVDQANYDGNSTYGSGKKGVFRGETAPVGSFPANAFGLHDMHGNVFEWCDDWFGDYPAKDAIDPEGPKGGRQRVLRGGAWDSGPFACRSAFRYAFNPASRRSYFGFRLCCS